MKSALLLLVSLLVVSSARATLMVYEPFNYDSTGSPSLIGQTDNAAGNPNPVTWVQAGAATASPSIAANSLTQPSPYPGSVGNSVLQPRDGNGAKFVLPTSVTSGTVYYSFLMKADPTNMATATGGGFFIGFNNTTASATSVPATLEGTVIIHTNGSGYSLGVWNSQGSVTANKAFDNSAAHTFGANDTVLVVAAYTQNPNAGDDVASLWINPPTDGSSPAPDVTSTGGDVSGGVGVVSFALRDVGTTFPNNGINVDEIRIADNFQDALGVPEPASLGLMSLAAIGMLRRRRV